jgi:hypothetical protein
LETRIDEQPLPRDAGIADSVAAVREMAAKAGGRAMLMVQSSMPASGAFVRLPAAIAIEGAAEWNRDAVRNALAEAAGKLWTTGQLGAGWASSAAGVDRLDGLGTLEFAIRGRRLFVANDTALLGALLARDGSVATAGALTYAAGFRHTRERDSYRRVMSALDFTSTGGNAPSFFSGNIGSMSEVLSNIAEMRMVEERRDAATRQTVTYRLAPR